LLLTNIPLGLAFLAGLASFLSPCVFSILPAYVSYLGGRSLTNQEQTPRSKAHWHTFFHGLAFIVGFSLVFILLGLAFSAIGKFFTEISPILSKIGGVIIILFGLNMTGLLKIPFLSYDLRLKSKSSKNVSLASSFLLGVVFSAGWSPCIGPTLGLILTMAMNSTSISNGVLLLALYSLGMGIPFLITSLGIGWVTKILQRHKKALHVIEIVFGVILIIVGIMLYLGVYQQLLNFDPIIDFGI